MKQWGSLLVLAILALAPFGLGDFGGINGGPNRLPAMSLWLLGVTLFFAAYRFLSRANGAGNGGLCLHPGWGRNLAIGLVWGFLCITLAFFIDTSFGKYQFALRPEWPGALFSVAMGTLFIALSEELVFRGYVPRMMERSSPTVVATVSSLLFVALHLKHWGSPPQYWLGLFVKGLFYVVPVLATRSVWFGVGHHWAWNFIHFLAFGGVTALTVERAAVYPWMADWGHFAVAVLMAVSAPAISRLLTRNDR